MSLKRCFSNKIICLNYCCFERIDAYFAINLHGPWFVIHFSMVGFNLHVGFSLHVKHRKQNKTPWLIETPHGKMCYHGTWKTIWAAMPNVGINIPAFNYKTLCGREIIEWFCITTSVSDISIQSLSCVLFKI